jgi:hypothetical protein
LKIFSNVCYGFCVNTFGCAFEADIFHKEPLYGSIARAFSEAK